MCVSSDESMRSNRRPVSRNNEHDYSTWKIDEYDMDLSEYLIEEPPLKEDDDTSPASTVDTQVIEQEESSFDSVFDETKNFDISTKKKVRKTYSCPICDKMWVTPSKLKRHMNSHKKAAKEESPPANQIQCPICNDLLDSPQKLTQHMADTHIKMVNRPEYSNGVPLAKKIGTRYICTVCSFEFSSPQKLYNHMKSQHMKTEKVLTSRARHVCPFCQKIVATPSKLQRHLRTHNRSKSEMKQRRPIQPRRHECVHCGKKFVTPSKLLRHITSVHRQLEKITNSSEAALEISTVTSILGD